MQGSKTIRIVKLLVFVWWEYQLDIGRCVLFETGADRIFFSGKKAKTVIMGWSAVRMCESHSQGCT